MKRLSLALALTLVTAACPDKNGSTRTDPAPTNPPAPSNGTEQPADPPAPPPIGSIEPGQIGSGTTSEAGLVAQIKPLVYNLHGGDPLQIAVHFQRDNGPIAQDEPRRDLDRLASVATFTIHLTMPNGTRHDLRADAKDLTGKQRYNYGLYFAPTFILTVGPDGLQEASGIGGPWRDKPPRWSSGTFDVAVSGSLALEDGATIDFETEAVRVATGVEDVLPRDELIDRATEVLLDKVPGAAPARGYGYAATESGFVSDLVLEIMKGQRVVRFAVSNSAWTYELHSVTLDPEGNTVEFATKSVKTCVAEGTAIATPAGSVAVEALEVGDEVWSWDLDRGERVTATVDEIRTGLRDDTLWLGELLRVTPEHPVYAGGAWIPAGAVDPSTPMMGPDGDAIALRARPSAAGAVRVFDLTVARPHNFFAGGLLVHNKDRGYWPKLDDPWFFMWDPNYR